MGTVSEIKILTTVLISPDNKKLIIPNNKIMSENITNHTAYDIRRIDLLIGISYSDDINKAKETLQEILKSEPGILQEPASFIGVNELAESSVNIVVWTWVKTPDYLRVLFSLREHIKITFDKQGIQIPFPQRDIHLFNT